MNKINFVEISTLYFKAHSKAETIGWFLHNNGLFTILGLHTKNIERGNIAVNSEGLQRLHTTVSENTFFLFM